MAVCECRGIERGERARWFWMRTVPSNIILWERRARAGRFGSFTRGFCVATKFSPPKREGTNEPENLKGERSGGFIQKEREREMIDSRFVQIRLRRLARKYSPLSPLRGVPTSNSSTKSLPGHRLRHAVVHQPNRFPNPPIYGRKTSLGRHHRSRRLPTIRLRGQILRVPLLTGRGTRVQGGF